MKISFVDFWGDFLNDNNFFYHLMREIKEDVVLTSPSECDILFCGCYSGEHQNYKNAKKIYYSSEPWSIPDMNVYHFSITGDKSSERNIRMPHWMYYIDWFNVKTYSNPEYVIPIDYFFGKNEFNSIAKSRFASWVYNNQVPDRINTIKNINRYKQIDLFGNSGQIIPYGESNKLKVISNYKFNFCFENTVREGYYTEKLIHAKVAGCIPIYKSHESFIDDFNELSCLNVVNMTDDEIFESVISIDTDNHKYMKMMSEPLFSSPPNLDRIKNEIYKKII